MNVSIANLKAHVVAFITATGAAIDGDFHHAVEKFAVFVEGKQALQDAVDLLAANGYHVTPPTPAAT